MRSKKSGTIMVFTLAVLAGVVAALATAAAMQRVGSEAATNRVDHIRAEIAAESGLQAALSALATQSASAANQNDPWYLLGHFGEDNFLTDSGNFRLQIIDAGSLVNLNSATQAQLANLPLSQPQIDSLLDWIQVGPTPRPQGAKDSFYNNLQTPYNTAEAPLQTVDQLLQIDNFTPATLFTVQQGVNGISPPQQTQGNVSYQPTLYDMATVDSSSGNTNSQGAALTSISSATQQQLQQAGIPARTAAAILAARPTTLGAAIRVRGVTLQNAAALLNNFTGSAATATGKININTATAAILQTIPSLPTDAVSGIVSRQANTGFATLGDITSVPGMTLGVLQQTADMFTTNSQAFIVRVIGTVGNISVPLEAIVTIKAPPPTAGGTGAGGTGATGGAGGTPAAGSAATAANNNTPPVSITKVIHPPFNNMIPYWHWDNQTSNDVDLRTVNS